MTQPVPYTTPEPVDGSDRVLSAFDVAAVKVYVTGSFVPGEVLVQRGQHLPNNLVKGEIERLDGLGAFGVSTRNSFDPLVVVNDAASAPLSDPDTGNTSVGIAPDSEPHDAASMTNTRDTPLASSEDEQIAPTDAAAGSDYAAMTVSVLKAEATDRGLDTTGTKADLVNRLTADDQAFVDNTGDTPAPPTGEQPVTA